MFGFFLINLLEIFAFVAAVFYYRKHPFKPNYYLAFFLGITVVVEVLSWYTAFIDDGFLHFLKDTRFYRNYWLGNIYTLVSYVFYINYFKWFQTSHDSRVLLNWASIIFLGVGILEITITGDFFIRLMPVTNIVGTLFLFWSIGLYYLKLLRSDQILLVHKSLPFYISVGALMFHLCTTPLFIYGSYYSNSIDPSFVTLYRWVIFGTNYLLYSIYILGFLVCLRIKDPYYHNKNY